MKFFSVKSNASAVTGEFSTPPESPTIKTKEPRTSSSSAEGSADSGATPAAEGDAARPPIPPPRIRRPGNSKLERLKLAEGGGGGGGGGGGTSGVVGGGGVLSVSDMILAPPPPPTNNEHFLKGSERADGLTT